MRKIMAFYLIVLCMTLLVSPYCFAKEDLSDFRCSKTIQINGINKYKSLFLDEDVYKYSNENLSDIRVVDNDNNFVPYYLNSEYSNSINTNIIYNSEKTFSYKKDNISYFNFKIFPLKYNEDILGNKIYLEINRAEYLKDIEVYGSYDEKEWNYLLTDRIYSVQNVSRNYIEFNDVNRYKYYRIGIIDNVEDLQIVSLRLENNSFQTSKNNYGAIGNVEYKIKNIDKETYITLKNINKFKINNIQLNTEGIFKRRYDILVQSENNSYDKRIGGELYNLNFKNNRISNTGINFNEPISQDIQIKIYNYDDSPLKINDIKVGYYVDKLVFEAKEGKTYKLYFGNNNAKPPNYDIQDMKSYIESEEQDECSLLELDKTSNTSADKKDYNFDTLFNIVMILASIILVIFIGMKFKPKSK